MLRVGLLAFLLGAGLATSVQATVLSFDVPAGDGDPVPQSYGDRVTAEFQDGFFHGIGPEGPTPNVVVAYEGSAGLGGAIGISDYHILENVVYNDRRGDTALRIRFTADPGYRAVLYGFAMGGFRLTDRTIAGITILNDNQEDNVLFQRGSTLVRGDPSEGLTTFTFANGLRGRTLLIDFDISNLGELSHTVGVDGIVFGQEGAAVPEPQAWALMILGFMSTGQALRLRRRPSPACPA